ncbi:hypothetical protein GF339_09075 [candidate division KSB3 bacterium]|uniref:Uncharacterized protein n=1 Tax=candidate division KSB3 bacterium TaxID=2044937 RepID=A0A9D5JV70_9BACT|nr:hypothetical protein [candidate division KSB3 bacterium]
MRHNTFGKGAVLIALLAIVAIGMLGCSEESRMNSDITAPTVAFTDETTSTEAEQLANFGAVNRTISLEGFLTLLDQSNKYVIGPFFDMTGFFGPGGAQPQIPFFQLNAFWVYVVDPGDYLLTYETWYGAFHIMFRTPEPGAIAIYLHPRDVAFNITMTKGMIPAGVSEAPTDDLGDLGKMQVFGMVPYMGDLPSEFIPMEVTPLVINMMISPDIGVCPAPFLPCYPF